MQQVKDAILRCDPLHVQISKLQTAIGRAEGIVKNRKEQLWQSQEALTKAQDHLWELQRRLDEVTLQRKEEKDQGYDAMDLQDGPGSWWDADSPGSDDNEEHARESSPQSWRSWGGYQDQPRQDWHKSQCALEDLSVKFAEMQQFIGNITPDRGHVGDSNPNTPAEAECVCRWSWLCCPCDAASFAAAGTVVAEQEASEGQSSWGRQPQKVHGWCGRRRFVNRSVWPALGCAAGSSARDALVMVKQLRLHMGMRHSHDVLQVVGMQQRELDQMHEMFLGLPLAADEEQVTCLTIFTDGSASLDAAWPRRRTAAGWGAVVLQGKPGAEQGLIGVVGGQVVLHRDHLHLLGATTRTVSTAEITGIAVPAAYLRDVCCVQEISFIVDRRHAMGFLSGQMRALANVELVQYGRALISRLSECAAVQWRHVALHTGIVYSELASDRVAAFASRGGVVSAIGQLPRRETPDASGQEFFG